MRVLITIGGTREPIDAVRFISNRSSGRIGAAIAEAALEAGHGVTAIAGQVGVAMPEDVNPVAVETTRQMHDAVLAAWPDHDALVMAAAVADFRPTVVSDIKLRREAAMTLELEPTEDILAAAGAAKRDNQFVVGFSLDEETPAALDRAAAKLRRKRCDLLVFNPIATMESGEVRATLLRPDGSREALPQMEKAEFARRLVNAMEHLPTPRR